MTHSRFRDAPAPGAAEGRAPAEPAPAAADPARILRFNNALQVFTNAAWYVAAPFVPVYLAAHGEPVAVVGAVVGCSGIVPLLVSVHAGALVDERGPAVVAQLSVALFAAAGVILTLLHSVWAVAVAYTLMGVGNIGFAVSPQAIVAAASTAETRVRNYGYYALWNSAGAVIGPLLGGVVAGRFGYTAAFALVWLLMIPAFAVAASLRGLPAAPGHAVSLTAAHRLIGTIVRQPGVGTLLFITIMAVCAQSLQQSFYPLYLREVGLSATRIGIVIAAVSFSSMLVRSALTRGVQRLGYARLLLGALALVAVVLGVIPFLRRIAPLLLASGLMGASFGFTQPLTMSLVVESVAAEHLGVAFGVRQMVQRVGAVASPLMFGWMSTAHGLRAAFLLGALMLAASVPVVGAGRLGRPPAD